MKTTQLRNRIFIYFFSIVLLLSLLFSAINLVFSYVVEDNFFYQILDSEKQQIRRQLQKGEIPNTHFNFISYHRTRESLPAVVKQSLEHEPRRKEVSDEAGKHYHLAFLNEVDRHQNILLADVSEQLVVEQLKGQIFGFSSGLLVVGLLVALMLALGTVRLAKRLVKPLDDLMAIVDSSPVEKLPTNFAAQFQQNEIGKFASTLEVALERISAFVKREQHFTRDISHELRTPLTISQGAVSLLTHTGLNARQQTLVARIDDANQQMQSTIEALLSMAREKSSKEERTNLKSIIESCIVNNHTLLKHETLALDVTNQAFVTMGAQELRLVIQNLLQNAAYHSQGNKISIVFNDKTLVIADNGKGFHQSIDTNQAFDVGHRGPSSNGSGIGLSLVKRLCEKYNVQVALKSSSAGASISLIFP